MIVVGFMLLATPTSCLNFYMNADTDYCIALHPYYLASKPATGCVIEIIRLNSQELVMLEIQTDRKKKKLHFKLFVIRIIVKISILRSCTRNIRILLCCNLDLIGVMM